MRTQVIFICVFAILAFQTNCICSCPEIKWEADCKTESYYCEWKDKKCLQRECSDFDSESKCDGQVVYRLGYDTADHCFWTGSQCKTAHECSDLKFDKVASLAKCKQYGECHWLEGSNECETPHCRYFLDKKVCNFKRVINNDIPYYCYWDKNECLFSENCEGINNSISCQSHGCEWEKERCQKILTVEDLTEDCSFYKNKKSCLQATNKNQTCLWDGVENCYPVTHESKCEHFKTEGDCPVEKCKWQREKCQNLECFNFDCKEPMAYKKQGEQAWSFCIKQADCIDGYSRELEDKCYELTEHQYAWDGSNCNQCSSKNAYLLTALFAIVLLSSI